MIGIFLFVCLLTCYDIVLVQFCAAAPIPKELADGTFNNHRSRDVMYAGRFILGIGVGIEGGGVGVYISESVPSNKRGSLVSLYQLSIALERFWGTPLLLSSTRCTEGGVSWWVRRWCFLRLC